MRKEIEPVAEEIDREARFPEGIWQTLGDLGVLGLGIPEAYGGSGMDKFTFTLVVEHFTGMPNCKKSGSVPPEFAAL
jgi:alkylation response protein AidB-like acyl-CoA dehydrogenase